MNQIRKNKIKKKFFFWLHEILYILVMWFTTKKKFFFVTERYMKGKQVFYIWHLSSIIYIRFPEYHSFISLTELKKHLTLYGFKKYSRF